MCGVLGFCGDVKEGQWGQTHRLLEAMFLASEHRGEDATGFAALTSPYKCPSRSRVVMAKEPIPASRFIRHNSKWRGLRHQRSRMLIGHVRFATHGAPLDNRNNHPHSSPGDGLHLIHNGIITNHVDVARYHKLNLQSQCDSEVVLALAMMAEHPALGLATALAELQGSLACILLDAENDVLWLGRNEGRPLWLSKLHDGRWFFASTQAILSKALKVVFGKDYGWYVESMFPLAPMCVHALTVNGLVALTEVEPRRLLARPMTRSGSWAHPVDRSVAPVPCREC
jgi:glucosamine--fructose-6-phosphate aminotransferase (isomerizing)